MTETWVTEPAKPVQVSEFHFAIEKRCPDFVINASDPICKSGDPCQEGEGGKAVIIDVNKLSHDQKKLYETGYKNNEFNQYTSDLISVHRALPIITDKECLSEKYHEDLPDTSVVVCFHNEAWSVLLRTVHSVLERSPDKLLKELRNQLAPYCLSAENDADGLGKMVVLHPCNEQDDNQFWMLSKDGEIRRDEICVDYAGEHIMAFPCHDRQSSSCDFAEMHGNDQRWHALEYGACEASNMLQRWKFKEYSEEKAKEHGVVVP
ncbi:ricin-type beta-trefoil lectin domain protein [Ancylostoma ceylanicum]|uniref:Ricin-type beta-trefoil lectin domain protein n=1 Tax=Ancylostoma ceylanicum TaxID=53326 RepID=A0A0D6M227_9BILA|nr:ricin-type beta-trefoil lectin domain protein [Ancylostoma ceylanicum]